MRTLSIIAAIGKEYELGKDNDLLWHISADLKRFKRITSGHPVIMGRKTFNSIKNRPLPNRRNIVITQATGGFYPGVELVHSVDEAINSIGKNEEAFIIGGAAIYKQFLPLAHFMYLTQVDRCYAADTFFPRYDQKQWEIIENISVTNDEQAGVNYSFITLRRIS